MTLTMDWHPRDLPLTPVAVCVQGDAARHLARYLLSRQEAALSSLQGVSGKGLMLLLAPEESLPWVDGALYLGQDPAAPGLLLPTTLEPSLPLPLFERALRQRYPELLPPLAVLPGSKLLMSLSGARPIAREMLLAWLEANA